MRVSGRLLCARASAGTLLLLCIHATQAFENNKYGIPVEIKIWDTGRTPLARMVDVTNGFGLKVLAEHNFLNGNNIAFSPYGLLGILVALYEGIDGDSSYQVQRAMQLPWNRNVMRIGFRDIHRTLKTYFVPEEGFLAGLALNNENVTFNEGYKKVLRFYGFDLDNNEQLPTLAPTDGTNETTTMANPSPTMPTADAPTTMPATAREDTTPTPNPNAETLSDIDIRGPTTEASPSSAPNAESTTATTRPATEVTSPQTTEAQTAAQITTTSAPTAEETTPTTAQTDTESVPAQMSSTISFTNEPQVNKEVDTTLVDTPTTLNSTPAMSTTTEPTIETSTNGDTTQTTENTASTLSRSETSTPASTDEPTTIASTIEILERRRKSIDDLVYSSLPYYNEPSVNEYLFHRSYDIPIPLDPESGSPSSNDRNQIFLVNGLRSVQVAYMQYDTILEHAYLPHLKASALRLPLDSDRYYLLVILPTSDGVLGLERLLARMARASDLSDVCSMLRPKRVRALVPSFTVKGHVTLTTDLQKLGIRDVFEPRQRDFTPMTHQAGVYVRSIEQAVSVAIRKYRASDASSNSSRYAMNQYPVAFSATYPFLYFVMDASIHVALIAGKMADPLNSRIL